MNKKRSAIIVSCIVLAAVVVFSGVLVHATLYAPEGDTFLPAAVSGVQLPSAATPAAPNTGGAIKTSTFPEYPSRLVIPSLNIDAKVQKVGVKSNGNMGVPTNFTDVAWYKDGTIPGQIGSAVIDGHVDNGLSLAGVFKHLDSIQKGDDVYVVTEKGTKLHFVVTATDLYDYKNTPNDLIFNEKGAARLRLITCTGDWVGAERTYNKRLVVTAELVS
jgi:LPXTG-site transpeptidase (sortase) family protein